ncbi:MAG: HAD family hydrolase [Nitrospirota bacterium]|jgi:FMN phosphatase YigB (HAD superfamily)|nr:HAD family hydrolase [Nitrospirota bacterium]MDX2420690.1 HAD family hydrolase [Nitrospirota bacterium]
MTASLITSETNAVLFDFGGTLDANGIPWKERMLALLQKEGVQKPNEELTQAFYQADDSLVGTISPSFSFQQTVELLVQRLFQALGIANDVLSQKISGCFIQEAQDQITTNVTFLTELSHHYRLGIVSNFYGNLATVCQDVGLGPFFMEMIDSTTVGYLKPDPNIFSAALTNLHSSPAQAVFIGDSLPRDMAGARNVGMAHIWLTPKASEQRDEPCCPGDPVVHTLEEARKWLL